MTTFFEEVRQCMPRLIIRKHLGLTDYMNYLTMDDFPKLEQLYWGIDRYKRRVLCYGCRINGVILIFQRFQDNPSFWVSSGKCTTKLFKMTNGFYMGVAVEDLRMSYLRKKFTSCKKQLRHEIVQILSSAIVNDVIDVVWKYISY
jgi:hypothetical protein